MLKRERTTSAKVVDMTRRAHLQAINRTTQTEESISTENAEAATEGMAVEVQEVEEHTTSKLHDQKTFLHCRTLRKWEPNQHKHLRRRWTALDSSHGQIRLKQLRRRSLESSFWDRASNDTMSWMCPDARCIDTELFVAKADSCTQKD